MKKAHRLFIIQATIAFIIFIVMSYAVKSVFYSDPKAESYLTFDEGVKNMATSTTALVDTLIAQDDLTFDPSSGKSMDKVLKNLKYTEGDRFLFVGSSQLRVVQGEEIVDAYQKLVSRKITNYTNYSTYNLSIGGMKTQEKLIVAAKGIQVIQPVRTLISVTPWDCIIDEVRPIIKSIENNTYSPLSKRTTEASNEESSVPTKVFPLHINDKITAAVDKVVEENIDIYRDRAAIKRWLSDEIGVVSKDDMALEAVTAPTSPDYWRTLGQELNNITGWDRTTAKTGTSSLKIENKEASQSKWLGEDIILKKPTDTFEFEGWSKAENVSEAKLYCLDFKVTFEDGTSKWHYKGLIFEEGTHDWQKVKTRVRFDKKVTSIKPHILFYGGIGTVWFDDISAKPIYDGKIAENVLPNPDFESELKERAHVSYTLDDAEWKHVEDNMISVVDFLSKQKTTSQNVLLLTPFWYYKNRTAYPQKAKYKALQARIKQYCKEKNVAFVDASYILSKDNFGVYTTGSVRDKIDVMHFNADAHEKLSRYIIRELKLK